MANYKIEITETLSRVIEIEALLGETLVSERGGNGLAFVTQNTNDKNLRLRRIFIRAMTVSEGGQRHG